MNDRIPRDTLMMRTAQLWAARSTCDRLHVGAVFHRNGRILVQGYNGAPAGLPHCRHLSWNGDSPMPVWVTQWWRSVNALDSRIHYDEFPEVNHDWQMYTDGKEVAFASTPPGCTVSVHAEQNGIAWAARHGVALGGAELTVTHQPCKSCAMSIINAGIVEVTYNQSYRLTDGVELLHAAGIPSHQLTLTKQAEFDRILE